MGFGFGFEWVSRRRALIGLWVSPENGVKGDYRYSLLARSCDNATGILGGRGLAACVSALVLNIFLDAEAPIGWWVLSQNRGEGDRRYYPPTKSCDETRAREGRRSTVWILGLTCKLDYITNKINLNLFYSP